jgi:hypothetical protein
MTAPHLLRQLPVCPANESHAADVPWSVTEACTHRIARQCPLGSKLGIFDQRALFLSALLNYFAIGNVKWTEAPWWRGSNQSRPPCASTIDLHSDSPTPSP